MGALAGHLSHLHENLNLSFGELKSILQNVLAGETPTVEKVDGQNIFFAFAVDPTTGTIKTARNKGDLLKGGMSPDEFSSRWVGHPAEGAFMNGFMAIESALGSMGSGALQEIFEPTSEDGKRFVNAEIIYTGNPNVINYGGDYIVMHNLQEFDAEGNLVDVQLSGGEFSQLVQNIENSQHEIDQKSWTIIGPQITTLQNLSNTEAYEAAMAGLDSLGVSDDMTLGDFVEEKLRTGPIGSLSIPTHKQEELIKRIIGIGKGIDNKDLPPLLDIKRGLPKETQKQVSTLGTQANAMKVIGSILSPIELVIHNIAVDVLRGLASALTGGHDDEIQRLKDELESAKEQILAAKDAKAPARRAMLEKQLKKLGSSENIASSMEGIVFEHPPGSKSLYKLTGAFAPLNQIIGAAMRIPSGQNESLLRNYVREFVGAIG